MFGDRRDAVIWVLVLLTLLWYTLAHPAQITATWQQNQAGPPEEGFIVEQELNRSGEWSTITTAARDIETASWTGELGTTVCTRVIAWNAAGNSLPSPVACVSLTPPIQVPGAPQCESTVVP